MDWLSQIGRRLLMLVRRNGFDVDLDEEMRLHRELREQEQIEHGLSPKEAHYAVQRRFGNDLVLREESRDMWGWNRLETFHWDNMKFVVIGVVGDVKEYGARTSITPQAYYPFTLALWPYCRLTLKTRIPPISRGTAVVATTIPPARDRRGFVGTRSPRRGRALAVATTT